jgi:xylulokinase
MGAVIGVDVGSQSVKGLLLDDTGLVRAAAGAPLGMSHPEPGHAEQDPREWEAALETVVHKLVSDSGLAGGDVSVLGLGCQVDGVAPVGDGGIPLAPAIIWLDRRAEAEAAWLRECVGAEQLAATTGLVPDPSHIAAKILWIQRHQPQVWATAIAFPPVAGYLVGRLTGRLSIDHANASSTMLYDVTRRDWDADLLGAVGVTAKQLGTIHESVDVAGSLTQDAAHRLGLSTRCQVLVGTGDDHAGAIGAGVIAPGPVADITGTAEPVATCSTTPVRDPDQLVETHAHAVAGQYLVENPGFVSGGSVLWLARTILGVSQAEILQLAEAGPPGAGSVRFLPALSGSMAPRWNGRMRGAFAGLSMSSGPAELARAVVEGCCFALRDVTDRFDALGLNVDEIRVVGGGTRSPGWMQMKADVTGRPVRAVEEREASAMGAALLAAVAGGVFVDLAEAVARSVTLATEPFLPTAAHEGLYLDAYQQYRTLFDGVEGALT